MHRHLAALDDPLKRPFCWTWVSLAFPLKRVKLDYVCWRFERQTWRLVRGGRRTWCPYLGLQSTKNLSWIERQEPCGSKATCDVLFAEWLFPSLKKQFEEPRFADVINPKCYHRFDKVAVRPLKHSETANVKRLEVVRRVRRHALCKDPMLSTEFVEFGRQMASMAVENEEPISTNSPVPSLWLEDLSKPLEGLSCRTMTKCGLCLEDDHRIKTPASCVVALDDTCPLSISRLNNNRSIPSVRPSDYFRRACNAHLEASLVKIVDIVVENTILGDSFLHPCKPR